MRNQNPYDPYDPYDDPSLEDTLEDIQKEIDLEEKKEASFTLQNELQDGLESLKLSIEDKKNGRPYKYLNSTPILQCENFWQPSPSGGTTKPYTALETTLATNNPVLAETLLNRGARFLSEKHYLDFIDVCLNNNWDENKTCGPVNPTNDEEKLTPYPQPPLSTKKTATLLLQAAPNYSCLDRVLELALKASHTPILNALQTLRIPSNPPLKAKLLCTLEGTKQYPKILKTLGSMTQAQQRETLQEWAKTCATANNPALLSKILERISPLSPDLLATLLLQTENQPQCLKILTLLPTNNLLTQTLKEIQKEATPKLQKEIEKAIAVRKLRKTLEGPQHPEL